MHLFLPKTINDAIKCLGELRLIHGDFKILKDHISHLEGILVNGLIELRVVKEHGKPDKVM